MELLQIENKAGRVKLDGQVTETAMDILIDRMATLYGDEAVKNQLVVGDCMAVAGDALESLEIEINSPGGSVKQGYRAYKTIMELRERGVHVTARITKLAASMGSILATAADKVLIESGAKMMIHDASMIAWGNAADLKRAFDLINGVSDELAAIYAAKTGKPVSDMRDLMKKETWMDAETSVSMGFADEVYKAESSASKAKTKLDRMLDGDMSDEVDIRVNESKTESMKLIDRLTSPSTEEATARIEALENQITGHDAEITEFQAKLETAEAALQEAAGFKVELEALQTEATALKAENADLVAKLDEQVKATEEARKSTGEQAIEALAAIGQPAPLPITNAEKPEESVYDQYRKLQKTDPRAAAAFWEENEAAIKSH